LYTSGGPKKAGTPQKRIEGVIQHSGITVEISTVSIETVHESNIEFCYVKVDFDDTNGDLKAIWAEKWPDFGNLRGRRGEFPGFPAFNVRCPLGAWGIDEREGARANFYDGESDPRRRRTLWLVAARRTQHGK
jgi:hypothetical protein